MAKTHDFSENGCDVGDGFTELMSRTPPRRSEPNLNSAAEEKGRGDWAPSPQIGCCGSTPSENAPPPPSHQRTPKKGTGCHGPGGGGEQQPPFPALLWRKANGWKRVAGRPLSVPEKPKDLDSVQPMRTITVLGFSWAACRSELGCRIGQQPPKVSEATQKKLIPPNISKYKDRRALYLGGY